MHVANLELCKELYKLSGWEYDQVTGYSLAFLLRKLPKKIRNGRPLQLSALVGYDNDWQIGYPRQLLWHFADTPENAACKLAIELFKQGVLAKLEVAGSGE